LSRIPLRNEIFEKLRDAMNIPGRHGVIKMVSSFLTAATICIVYPPLTALRVHLGIFPTV
jgi:hypothetical protein